MLASLVTLLGNIIDFFIHEDYKTETGMRFKVRLLVGCTLTFFTSVLGFGFFYIAIQALTPEAALVYLGFALPLLLFWAWMLHEIRQGRHYHFSAQAVIGSAALVLFGGIMVTGGPARTEVHPMVIVPVVLAFLMLGQRTGLIWALVVGACNYLLVGLDYLGVEFINVAPPEAVRELRVFNWSYSFMIIIALVMIYEAMNSRLTRERDAERERFRHMAMHDALTGLPNRKYFDEALASTLALADRHDLTVAIGLVDLNGFKPINDDIGHDAGDVVLQAVGQRMQEALRRSDKVARLGGDEFALILNNVNSTEDVAQVCEKVLAAIAQPVEIPDKGLVLQVTGSLGVAMYPQDTREENQLRVFSDKAMYEAKRQRAGWRLYRDIPTSG